MTNTPESWPWLVIEERIEGWTQEGAESIASEHRKQGDKAFAISLSLALAAPDLLKACKLLMKKAHWDGAPQADLVDYGVHDAVVAAIAKAEGKP